MAREGNGGGAAKDRKKEYSVVGSNGEQKRTDQLSHDLLMFIDSMCLI